MKFTTSALLVAAALGATAHPSGHAHKHAHRSLEEREFIMYKKPEPTVAAPEPTTSAAAAPSVEALAEPKPAPKEVVNVEQDKPKADSPKPSPKPSGGEGEGVDSYTEFCGGASKRATLEEIAYKGNVGTAGNYGCNMMLAKSSVADKYKYVVEINNVADKAQECVCYNKIGPDNGINGFFDGNEALRFNVPAGATQNVVADENTQGGCVCDIGSVPLTGWGEFASTWTEFDFGNTSNDGWSGADASCLVSAAEGLDIPGLKICGHGTCSTINPGGTGTNAFLGGMEAEDGIGLNLPAGEVRLEVTIGFQGE